MLHSIDIKLILLGTYPFLLHHRYKTNNLQLKTEIVAVKNVLVYRQSTAGV